VAPLTRALEDERNVLREGWGVRWRRPSLAAHGDRRRGTKKDSCKRNRSHAHQCLNPTLRKGTHVLHLPQANPYRLYTEYSPFSNYLFTSFVNSRSFPVNDAINPIRRLALTVDKDRFPCCFPMVAQG
jgi:hypothetical protein